jgi:hypothetical protein
MQIDNGQPDETDATPHTPHTPADTGSDVATIAGRLLHVNGQELLRRCSTESGRNVLADEIQAMAASLIRQNER